MATRREKVILDLESNLAAGMARDAAAAKLLSNSLDGLSGQAVQTQRATKTLNSDSDGLPALGKNADRSGNQIDKLSGRMKLLAEAAAVLGPGLVPLGAAAVGGMAALSTQMVVAGTAAGVTMLAFKGLGGSLKALNEYQLDPSTANFEKMQQEMQKLGPAAQDFVRYLQKIRPVLGDLRNAAQDGLLPGAQEGLQNLMRLLPQVEAIIGNTGFTVGRLLAEAGDSLAGPKWKAFFDYLQTDAQRILTEMGKSLGNVVQGLASMMVAFTPLTADFSAGLLRMSRSFAEWSAGLSSSDGFAAFMDYIRTAGPQVLDLLGALGNMFVQIATAAAPLGGPVLESLTAVANVIAAIADSSLGTPIFTALAAMALLNRATVLWGALATSASGKFIAGMVGAEAATARTATSMTALQRAGMAAGGVLATIAIGDALQGGGLDKSLPTVNELANTLKGLGNDGSVARIPKQFNDIGDAIKRIGDANPAQKLQDSIAGVIGFGGGDDVKNFKAQIDLLDQALTQIASSQGAGAAKSALADFAEAQHLSADQLTDLLRLLPGYRDAIAGTSSATDGMTAATAKFTAETDRNTKALQGNITAMRTKRSEALAGMNAEIGYQASLDDARKSLKENGRTLDITTEKGRNNKSALLSMAAAWNAQNDAAKNAPGAHRQAIASFVRIAHAMGMPIAQARALARRILEIPSKKINITADASQALRVIAQINYAHIANKTFTITTYYDAIRRDQNTAFFAPPPGSSRAHADGGAIYGPGTATSDSIPAYLSNGEYVIKAAAVDKYGTHMFDKLNAMAFADGGPVQRFASGGRASNNNDAKDRRDTAAALELKRAQRELRTELAHFKAELSKTSDRLKTLQATARDFRASVKDGFNNDPFGSGLSDAMMKLRADANDANEMRMALNRAQKLGLSGTSGAYKALAASGDLQTAKEINTRAEARAFQAAYSSRSYSQNLLGSTASTAAFGRAIHQQNREVYHLRRLVDKLDLRLERSVERGARKGVGDNNRKTAQRRRVKK